MLTRTIHIICIVLIFLFSFLVHGQSSSAYIINNHKYDMQEDLFFRAVQEWYDATLDSIGLHNLVDSLAGANEITITKLDFPEDVLLDYLEDSTEVFEVSGKITIQQWVMTATGRGCTFLSLISEMGIYFKANSEFVDGKLNISDINTTIFEPVVEVVGSGGFLCPIYADTLRSFLANSFRDYLLQMAQAFEDVGMSGLFNILSPVQALQLSDPDLVSEALAGFPMDMAIYTSFDPVSETTQLITQVNFLTGTSADPNAFLEIEPDKVAASGLKFGGLSYLYWVLQRGYSWHNDWSESQRVDAALLLMADQNINDYRLEIRWRDFQKKAYLGDQLHPDSLNINDIDLILADITHWDTSILSGIQNILSEGFSRNLVPFMAIGIGHQDRTPPDDNGNSIAPASEEWTGPNDFLGVSANEYLYNLKIYAHAIVRRFAADIDVWQIENELNAAGFAAADSQWWRKGDLWLEEDFRNKVWDILVYAVRTEDPSAKIIHDLHMLGFMPAMEAWLDDMDMVGVNFYPNQTKAIPVMGFMIGEYIWAVRRVLKGLGYPDKPVWLVETGYPGVERADAADSLQLKDDMLYFSEKRQAEYIETALNSASLNGASGFFYYSLTTQENMPDGTPELNKYMRYSGLLRSETDEPKPGLETFASQLSDLITNVSPEAMKEKIPQTVILHWNYPNPFNAVTVISWQLAIGSNVELIVYNLLGERVATLVSGHLNSGNYSYKFDGNGMASGVYYYQLVAHESREVRKMILLR